MRKFKVFQIFAAATCASGIQSHTSRGQDLSQLQSGAPYESATVELENFNGADKKYEGLNGLEATIISKDPTDSKKWRIKIHEEQPGGQVLPAKLTKILEKKGTIVMSLKSDRFSVKLPKDPSGQGSSSKEAPSSSTITPEDRIESGDPTPVWTTASESQVEFTVADTVRLCKFSTKDQHFNDLIGTLIHFEKISNKANKGKWYVKIHQDAQFHKLPEDAIRKLEKQSKNTGGDILLSVSPDRLCKVMKADSQVTAGGVTFNVDQSTSRSGSSDGDYNNLDGTIWDDQPDDNGEWRVKINLDQDLPNELQKIASTKEEIFLKFSAKYMEKVGTSLRTAHQIGSVDVQNSDPRMLGFLKHATSIRKGASVKLWGFGDENLDATVLQPYNDNDSDNSVDSQRKWLVKIHKTGKFNELNAAKQGELIAKSVKTGEIILVVTTSHIKQSLDDIQVFSQDHRADDGENIFSTTKEENGSTNQYDVHSILSETDLDKNSGNSK